MNINKLEQVLLSKETQKIDQEIGYHLKEIKSIIWKYFPKDKVSVNAKDEEDFDRWFNELKLSYTFYYGGHNLSVREKVELPEFIQKYVLERITKEFIEKVEEIQSLGNLEDLEE